MSCGKVGYDNRGEARNYAKRSGGAAQRPYLCPRCGLWHLTRKPHKAKKYRSLG